jgi:hypothetical protein
VNELPWHIVPLDTVTVGLGFTDTIEIVTPKQPAELAPVTVYVVLLVGVTTDEPLE